MHTVLFVHVYRIYIYIYIYIYSHWLYSPLGPWPLIFQFHDHLQTVGLLGRVISSSQGLYLNTGQHKHNKHTHTYQTCLAWDSNPRSRIPRERWPYMPSTARLPWPAPYIYIVQCSGSWSLLTTSCTMLPTEDAVQIVNFLLQSSPTRNYIHS
jgi:hypothetical protein